MPDRVPAVVCTDVVRLYATATGETHALRGVDASFDAGQVTAVTGPSGSGKSSLLGVVATRERPSGGEVALLGRPLSRLSRAALRELRRRDLGWVPQRPAEAVYPHLTALENLRTVAAVRGADRRSATEVLEQLGLSSREGVRPGLLSGGEQQRLAVAAAVVGAPAVVVADEPTAELDDVGAAHVVAVLRAAAAAGSAVVVATHDDRLVRGADRVLHLRYGVLSTDRTGGGPPVAAIDPTGRVQLPPEALALFPHARAHVVVDGGSVRLVPPEEPS